MKSETDTNVWKNVTAEKFFKALDIKAHPQEQILSLLHEFKSICNGLNDNAHAPIQ